MNNETNQINSGSDSFIDWIPWPDSKKFHSLGNVSLSELACFWLAENLSVLFSAKFCGQQTTLNQCTLTYRPATDYISCETH